MISQGESTLRLIPALGLNLLLVARCFTDASEGVGHVLDAAPILPRS